LKNIAAFKKRRRAKPHICICIKKDLVVVNDSSQKYHILFKLVD